MLQNDDTVVQILCLLRMIHYLIIGYWFPVFKIKTKIVQITR